MLVQLRFIAHNAEAYLIDRWMSFRLPANRLRFNSGTAFC